MFAPQVRRSVFRFLAYDETLAATVARRAFQQKNHVKSHRAPHEDPMEACRASIYTVARNGTSADSCDEN